MSVYIQREGQQYGPYPQEDIQGHLASGTLLPTDMAWQEGMADWVPLSEFPGIEAGVSTVQGFSPDPNEDIPDEGEREDEEEEKRGDKEEKEEEGRQDAPRAAGEALAVTDQPLSLGHVLC